MTGLKAFAFEAQFHEILNCGEQICLFGKAKPGSDLTLFSLKSPKTCVTKAGKNFHYEAPKKNADNPAMHWGEGSFDATEIVPNPKCGPLKNFYRAVANKKLSEIKIARSSKINNPKKISDLDALIKSSSAFKDQKMTGGKMVDKSLTRLSIAESILFGKEEFYLVRYQTPDHQKSYPYAMQFLVKGSSVFQMPSKGISTTEGFDAFEIGPTKYLNIRAGCDSCDSWTGDEMFEIGSTGLKLVYFHKDVYN